MSDDADDADAPPPEAAADPKRNAHEKADEIRLHAEIAAVFEGVRKFDARVRPGLDPDLARQVQRGVAKLEKSRLSDSPVIAEAAVPDAITILRLYADQELPTNDYHVHRRPGEAMLVRWLAGDEVAGFYDRLQAHFDAALSGTRDEQRQEAWRQDATQEQYLAALDALDVKMADRFLREPIREHGLYVISTQTADEMNIAFLCDHVMGVDAADVVGPASAPGESMSDKDLAWFYKLFLLRGAPDGVETMCFFCFLQKTDDAFDF